MVDYPIEILYIFVGVATSLTVASILAPNPKMQNGHSIPLLMFIAGALWVFLFTFTDNIEITRFFSSASDSVNPYDVQSSTGQVLINSVTAHSRGERLSNTSSELLDKTIDCITLYLGRSGSPPVGTLIQIGVMDTNTNFIKIFGTMNITQLVSSSVTPYQFCLPVGQTYTFIDTETWGLKYNAGDGSNTLTTRIDANNPFDGNNTEHVHSTGSSWIANTGQDIMGILTLRSSSGIVTPYVFPFDAFIKMAFLMIGASIMLFGALLVKFG